MDLPYWVVTQIWSYGPCVPRGSRGVQGGGPKKRSVTIFKKDKAIIAVEARDLYIDAFVYMKNMVCSWKLRIAPMGPLEGVKCLGKGGGIQGENHAFHPYIQNYWLGLSRTRQGSSFLGKRPNLKSK